MHRSLALAGLLAVLAAPAAAQTISTPIYKGPYHDFRNSELAGYISDPGSGISIALQGEYRRVTSRFDYGLTFGYLDPSGPGSGIFGIGVDGRASVARRTQDFPLDASLTLGLGGLIQSGDIGFILPIGISLGRQVLLEESKISFTPYVNPVIAPVFGSDNVVGNDVLFGLGLGVDISLSPRTDVRLSAGLGDLDGVGVGLAWHR
ncbi:MAG TPA: hypothetical protein VNH46_09095 [Gemmatimonadales bacterium]|nr:hypothetical protein [Gemmatimonadales bacterium]